MEDSEMSERSLNSRKGHNSDESKLPEEAAHSGAPAMRPLSRPLRYRVLGLWLRRQATSSLQLWVPTNERGAPAQRAKTLIPAPG